MGETTKGKKTDEIFLNDPETEKDQETFLDDADTTEDKVILSEENKEENREENEVNLEEPPTYDDIANEEWKENTEEIKRNVTCANCGEILRETDRFCPFCGMKCNTAPEDLTAAAEEKEQHQNAEQNSEEGWEGRQEKLETQAESEIPHICAEEIQESVRKEEEHLENPQPDTKEKAEEQEIQTQEYTVDTEQQEPHYTEEERRQQVLRMAQQDVNYGAQLENFDEKEEGKPKKKRKVWKIVLGTVASLAVLTVAGVYAAGVYHFQDRFFLNTRINGIDVSENTVEEFNNHIGNEIATYQIAVKERGDVTEYLTSADLGYGYTPKGEAEQAKDLQNPFLWPECLNTTYLYTFDTLTSYSQESLEQSVKNMACFKEENVVQPKDAYITKNGETYEIVSEVEGNLLNEEAVIVAVKNAVETGAEEISLEELGCYVEPTRRQDDAAMNSAVQQLNQYLSTEIEYIFGSNREVLDGSIIKDWISFDETTFEVYFDDEKLAAYVAELAEKYDTYNKDRHFTTNDGSVVTVSGGSGYGWKIDQAAEVAEVKQWITQGTQNIRYAVFEQEAVSWENCDLGDSYIEIDLTRQHVWLYIDGKELVSTDCVSGDMTIEGRMTPAGTYTLYYLESPSILKGEGYEDGVEVQYWMPFNGGVGLHDASWRTDFGGQIYISNGSHGCVNLPSDKAKMIYDNIYPGIPIICYYR
ncbi:MAG: peptidoglycan binding domain-containing protein [Eubacteriales bacterium]|nr:peptidoglycan binding domain-containing protein [Eubacteriales bacterium]